jgi:hypothetical protein
MTEHTCTYTGDREEALVAYLYSEMAAAERAAFEPHLAACASCRAELIELGGVQTRLAQWSPPEPRRALAAPLATNVTEGRRWQALHDLPMWAKTAAAVLVAAAAVSVANLDVRYDADGLAVRSGWMAPPVAAPRASSAVPAADANAAAATLADTGAAARPATVAAAETAAIDAAVAARVSALRDELRQELSVRPAAADPAAIPAAASLERNQAALAEAVRQVRAQLEETDSRQQRELALRVAELRRDVDAQRQGDLVRIERALNVIQNQSVMGARQQQVMIDSLSRQVVNSLAVRTGQER